MMERSNTGHAVMRLHHLTKKATYSEAKCHWHTYTVHYTNAAALTSTPIDPTLFYAGMYGFERSVEQRRVFHEHWRCAMQNEAVEPCKQCRLI